MSFTPDPNYLNNYRRVLNNAEQKQVQSNVEPQNSVPPEPQNAFQQHHRMSQHSDHIRDDVDIYEPQSDGNSHSPNYFNQVQPQQESQHPLIESHSNQQQTQQEYKQIREHGLKVHGRSAALDVKNTIVIKEKEQGIVDQNGEVNAFHTITIEAASSLSDGSRAFDWSDKIIIRLTSNELPLFIATCFGFLSSIKFGNHGVGDRKGKFFGIAHQGKNLFVQVGQPKEYCKNPSNSIKSIPVSLPDGTALGLKALGQYCTNFPNINSQTALEQIRQMANIYVNNGFASIENKLP
ncbi:hypothetical protein L0B53_19045 (plasmid) [Vibrio sp. SS-MA-C1-2]|uniref:hypothetical protein n=1 Tax=Vibrio sp. SS-MA-C1-2 TaxID=2908646 RepID=UPI001F3FFC33|nr:hypothetical protein [Vibrio sp. SS-MA-C1-2]UJF20234.1 hypothetical protein L0B53_19045 [Vibrio sp. SS-MA-C1-2]